MTPKNITKRKFLKMTSGVFLGTLVSPAFSLGNFRSLEIENVLIGQFDLPPIPYSYGALEPYIDEETMRVHHTKHHAGYTQKLNTALESLTAFQGLSIEEILGKVTSDEKEEKLRQNGGGYFNHSLFWTIMSPEGGGKPDGLLSDKINEAFGSYENFISEFKAAAGSVFGSGWAWLCKNEDGTLFITTTANQDSPLMTHVVDEPGTPIMGIDVWEHAYYLNYQNKRSDYIDGFFQIVNWGQVSENLMKV
jgi:Fe-Mn family superoxide dismutase